MNYQSYMVEACQASANEFFVNAKAVPEDKQSWSPLDAGRTVLDMCREIAMTPTWALAAFSDEKVEWSEEHRAEQRRLMESWATIEDCETQFKERFAKVSALYNSFSDSDLDKTKWLPYNGGRDHTFKEMMDYPRWNSNYHTGQICYIQTLYGDREMH